MKSLFLFMIFFVLSLTSFAASLPDDVVTIGQKGSTDDKALIFRDAAKTTMGVGHLTGDLSWSGDNFTLGDSTNSDKKFLFDVGLGAANPFFLWNAAKNKIGFSNDGTALKDIGSGSGGGGGGDNFNNGFGADDNGNAEDGTTGWTASAGTFAITAVDPIEGDQSFTWIPAAQNDTLDSPVLSFDKDVFRGGACQAKIEYIGGDENLTLQIIDANNDVLGSQVLNTHTIFSQESAFFLCPSQTDITGDANKGNLRYRILNEGAAASPIIKFDKSYLGTLVGLSETVLPDVLSANIDGSDGSIDQVNTPWVDSCTNTGTGDFNCTFISGTFSEIPVCSVTAKSSSSLNVYINSITATTMRIVSTIAASGSLINTRAHIVCQKQGTDAKQSVQVYKSIPKVSENVNTFSFSGNPLVLYAENVDWINGNCTQNGAGAGHIDCSFNPGIFTEDPSCSCSPENGNTTQAASCKVRGISTTGISVSVSNGNSLPSFGNLPINVICHKNGDDFRLGKTQNISLAGVVVNSQAESSQKQMRTETCRINSNATIGTAGSCNGWIDSVSKTNSDYTLNFVAGIFSAAPDCVVTGYANYTSGSTGPTLTVYDALAGSVHVETRLVISNAMALGDVTFNIQCTGRK
jgi:hypothetical protein